MGIGHWALVNIGLFWTNDKIDAIVIGSGIGGLVTATQLTAKAAKVLVLERYLIPGGNAGYFERQGYRFDVGASMIFGLGENGTTNLLTRALSSVNVSQEAIADPVQIHYHLPQGLDLKVDWVYEKFLQNLTAHFRHKEQGKAVGVQLANGKVYRGKRIVSNATPWDTFEQLLPAERMQDNEKSSNKIIKNLPLEFAHRAKGVSFTCGDRVRSYFAGRLGKDDSSRRYTFCFDSHIA